MPNIVWVFAEIQGIRSHCQVIISPWMTVSLSWIIKVCKKKKQKKPLLFAAFCQRNPWQPLCNEPSECAVIPSEAPPAPLLTVHSLCPQQMWHAVSTVPSKLAVGLSPAWRTRLVTQMACMTSASPSCTVLLNLTLRYNALLSPNITHPLWAGVKPVWVWPWECECVNHSCFLPPPRLYLLATG